jgi:hypothetical protein
MKLTLKDNYDEVRSRLLTVTEDGRVTIGTAMSRDPLETFDGLEEWTLFSDYVMEGFVTYYLRLLRKGSGAVVELRLAGTNRDRYIPSAIKHYLNSAGLQWDEGV